jgi:predicted cobalt transporter CbtA
MFAYADGFDVVLSKVNANIVNPVIEFAFIIATVVFLWGVLQFIAGAGDKEKRQIGKDHILWGIIGFVIMFSVFGIITILANTIGVTGLTVTPSQQTFTPPPIQSLQVPQ